MLLRWRRCNHKASRICWLLCQFPHACVCFLFARVGLFFFLFPLVFFFSQGKGQTIHLFVIPEVQSLIQSNIAACGQRFWTESVSQAKMNPSKLEWSEATTGEILVAVSGWLLLNSMRKEKVQFGMLIEQSMNNVWRKQSMIGLRAGYTQFGLPAPPTGTASTTKGGQMKASTYLESCLDMFRERIDHLVESSVPVPVKFTQKLDDAVKVSSSEFFCLFFHHVSILAHLFPFFCFPLSGELSVPDDRSCCSKSGRLHSFPVGGR